MNRFVGNLRFSLLSLLLWNVLNGNSQSIACHSNFSSISDIETALEDISIHRTYTLCPNTKFDAATLNSDDTFTDKSPLFVRSNVLVQCGADGSSQNSCVIDGNGDYGIIVDPLGWGFNESFVENVTIQGVTVDFFTFNSEYTVFPVSVGLVSGDVTFKDCIFSNNVGDPLFDLHQYIFPSRRLQLEEDDAAMIERELQLDAKVTFDSCTFDNNQGPENPQTSGGVSLLAFYGIDVSLGSLVTGTLDVDLRNNVFTNNIYSFDNDQAVYRSMIDFYSTGTLTMENNCFFNSIVSPLSLSSMVTTLDKSNVVFANNYLDEKQADLDCPYLLQYNDDLSAYVCQSSFAFNATECPIQRSPTTTLTPASLTPSPLPALTTAPVQVTSSPTSVTTNTAIPVATIPTTAVPSPTSSPTSGTHHPASTWTASLFISVLFIFVMP